ncbi:cytochrome P450 [Rhodobacterales bacterium HKCCE4037]|nr:cytochrome P450 [Rhodobacterales bacterium HKCCE4037]
MKPHDIRPQPRNPEAFSNAHDFDAGIDDFDAVHGLFSELRSRCPVAHSNDLGGFWLFTRYEDVEHAISTPSEYTTAVQNVVPRVATTGRRPPLHLDPPEHTPYRRALTPLFRRERMDHWNTSIRGMARSLFSPLLAKGQFDVCRDFGYPLPAMVLAEFFGISAEDADRVRAIGNDFTIALETMDMEMIQKTSLVLYETAARLIEDRKANPRDPGVDPVSALLEMRHNGETLPEDGILGTVRQLLVVGIIAPTTFIGSMVIHLSRHPEHLALLRAEPDKIPAAVDELLRLYTPYRGFARTPVSDTTVCGREIKADEPVALAFTAANRDPEVFREPDTFRLDRQDEPPHLAFGRGPHMCAGKGIAMVMITAALELFVEHVEAFEITGPVPMTTWPEYGPLSVPVNITPVAG